MAVGKEAAILALADGQGGAAVGVRRAAGDPAAVAALHGF
jgi:hypothetical protein